MVLQLLETKDSEEFNTYMESNLPAMRKLSSGKQQLGDSEAKKLAEILLTLIK